MRATRKLRHQQAPVTGRTSLRQTRVLLADDNPAIVGIVRELLTPAFDLVGAVTDGQSVFREVPVLNPDVIILDVSMGEPNGIEVARRLNQTSCHLKVVFLSVYEIPEFIRSAFAVGGSGYVFKSRMKTDLIPAINAVCSGGVFVSSRP